MGILGNIFKKSKNEPYKNTQQRKEDEKPKPAAKKEPEVKDEKKQTKKTEPVVRSDRKKGYQKKQSTAYKVLVRPMVSEKGTDMGVFNKYIFEVAADANKIEIKKAFEEVYGVKPASINIVNKRGKNVRYGRHQGVTKNTKKAIITLKSGDKIEVFQGV